VTDACIKAEHGQERVLPDPGKFLFWDGIHPTVAGHTCSRCAPTPR